MIRTLKSKFQKTTLEINVKKNLHKDLRNTKELRYRGHTGKWTISVTLPTLADIARKNRSTIAINLEILDPRDNIMKLVKNMFS